MGCRQGTFRIGQLKVVVGTLVQPRCQAHLGRAVRRGILILRPRRPRPVGVLRCPATKPACKKSMDTFDADVGHARD